MTYAYDGDGLRASKTPAGSTAQTMTWDAGKGKLPLLLSDGAVSYLYGPAGTPIEQIAGTVATYLHQDQLGSTVLITGSTGTVVGAYRYDPYGAATHTGVATTHLQFNGQYADDESDLIYLRARYYNPVSGQFLTRDPIASTTRAAYTYAAGNPLVLTDPSGLISGGYCVGGFAGAILGRFLQGCFVGAVDLRSGKIAIGPTATGGGGMYLIATAGAGTTYQVSSANTVDQLSGWSTYAGLSAGEGPGVGGDVFTSADVCGAPGDFVAGLEISGKALVDVPWAGPVEVHAGRSRTFAKTVITLDPVGWGKKVFGKLGHLPW